MLALERGAVWAEERRLGALRQSVPQNGRVHIIELSAGFDLFDFLCRFGCLSAGFGVFNVGFGVSSAGFGAKRKEKKRRTER